MKKMILLLIAVTVLIAGFSSCKMEPGIETIKEYFPMKEGADYKYKMTLRGFDVNEVETDMITLEFGIKVSRDENHTYEDFMVFSGYGASVSFNDYVSPYIKKLIEPYIISITNSLELTFKYNSFGLSLNGVAFRGEQLDESSTGISKNKFFDFLYFSDFGFDLIPVYMLVNNTVSSNITITTTGPPAPGSASYNSKTTMTMDLVSSVKELDTQVTVSAGSFDSCIAVGANLAIVNESNSNGQEKISRGMASSTFYCANNVGIVKAAIDSANMYSQSTPKNMIISGLTLELIGYTR